MDHDSNNDEAGIEKDKVIGAELAVHEHAMSQGRASESPDQRLTALETKVENLIKQNCLLEEGR